MHSSPEDVSPASTGRGRRFRRLRRWYRRTPSSEIVGTAVVVTVVVLAVIAGVVYLVLD